MRVRMLDDSPSWLDSWLLWRKFSRMGEGVQRLFEQIGYRFPEPFSKFLHGMGVDLCPFCEGWGEITDVNYGRAYCLCQALEWAATFERRARPFLRKWYVEKASLSDLKVIRGNNLQKDNLAENLATVERWMEWPTRWLVLSGPPGTGKTTILRAIAAEFPIAYYITANQFEQECFGRLADQSLGEFIDVLIKAPLLIFDDWGAEYASSYIQTKLMGVVDARYQAWRELITVVATNVPMAAFKSNNMRIGSRLLDSEKVIQLPFIGPDYRVPEH